jgi:hypothetical protein
MLNPSMLAGLAGASGPSGPIGPGGPPQGPPQSLPLPLPPHPHAPSEGNAGDKAVSALQAWLHSEQDPQDKAVISGLLQKAHQLQANEAKEKDAAIGVSPAQKFIRRQNAKQGV